MTKDTNTNLNTNPNNNLNTNTPPKGNSSVSSAKDETLPPRERLRKPDWVANVEPWPEPVDGKALLDELVRRLRLFIVLPKWAAETLALWILHTFAFELREVSTYIGIESPEKRCGKTTLLNFLGQTVNRAIAASNISSPAFFRVIEEKQPTLLIDEADTFLQGNDELRGILNSGYNRQTAFVVRVIQQAASQTKQGGGNLDTSGLGHFSCWCPKAIATIGRLPDTLADRCIVIRMQRKTPNEKCERFRNLVTLDLKRQCARFVKDHSAAIATAQPQFPESLNDRAADIWEPLFALADLAGGDWPELARKAAEALTASAQDTNPISSLLMDIFSTFMYAGAQQMFSRELVAALNAKEDRPWTEMRKGKDINDIWLSNQLRPYGIRSRNMRMGLVQAKGYELDDFWEIFRRYIPRSELEAFMAEARRAVETRDVVLSITSKPEANTLSASSDARNPKSDVANAEPKTEAQNQPTKLEPPASNGDHRQDGNKTVRTE